MSTSPVGRAAVTVPVVPVAPPPARVTVAPGHTSTGPVLVACSHGTDSTAGRAAIRALLDGVRAACPQLDVREAFVDLQPPRVDDVLAEVTGTRSAPGAGTACASVVVVPMLLSAGFHVQVDIAAAADRPGVVAAPALGPDPRLGAVLVDRLHEAGTGAGDAVVLAAAGSTDPRAAIAVKRVAAALAVSWTAGSVTVGYGAGVHPRVPAAVAAARRAGATRVVVASYLLAPGNFHDRLTEAGADAVTAPLAPDDRVVAVVLDRYTSAAAQLRSRAPRAAPF